MRYEINTGYEKAEKLARSHYENFPVLSFLIRKDLQKHIAVIYWFARKADDIADEGNLPDDEKLEELILFEQNFTSLLLGEPASPVEAALLNTIKEKNLDPALFLDLISAFKQDLVVKRYKDFQELLDYCRRSANPIGRLILKLHDINNAEALVYSDNICTALQLINFYQDVSRDIEKGRIYFPIDELKQTGVSETQFEIKENNINLEKLVKFSVDRAEKMLLNGKQLLPFLPARLRYEIKWTILGGKGIIDKIRNNNYNVFVRPELTKVDFLILLIKSFL